MNIGIVCYPTYGGSGVIATELGKGLAQRGHKIHFITYSRPIRLDVFSENIYYHEVRAKDYPLFEYVPFESALASMMVDVARHQEIDIFHVHYALPHAAVAYLAKQILKEYGRYVPVVTTLHGTDITLVGKNPAYESVVSFSIDQSDGVTAVSAFLKQATYENFPVRADIRVIPNFVDIHRFYRHDKDHFRRMFTPEGEKVLIHASNFRKVKRVDDVMRIFAQVRQAINCKLLMVGDGPERAQAEEMCRELGFCSDVIFLGSQNAVEEIFSIGDLFLMPSETESFGLSALEAMACGVPVISTHAGGLPEVVIDDYNGYTSAVRDVNSMAANAISLLQDPERWQRFSANAVTHARKYSLEAVVPEYEQYYEEVIQATATAVPQV
ncbi:MAG: N-acetyl-alpha-D-glucosaminyl L-malate synthase BshA [Bacteroidia bacterium]|nr:N-acetyl-alpha-D-glucosaminyl L-malate synthase BshA [Bacteroidia bacterium]